MLFLYPRADQVLESKLKRGQSFPIPVVASSREGPRRNPAYYPSPRRSIRPGIFVTFFRLRILVMWIEIWLILKI